MAAADRHADGGGRDDPDLEPARFETRVACETAARAFVKEYPAYDWWRRPDSGAAINPVYRSHVECVPADAG